MTLLESITRELGPLPEILSKTSRQNLLASIAANAASRAPIAINDKFGAITSAQYIYSLSAYTIPSPLGFESPWVLVSGGVHGDEPAGVVASHLLLESFAEQHLSRVNLVIIPCLNPTGFVDGTANTCLQINLNRDFSTFYSEEARHVARWLEGAGRNFSMAFDLHEIPPYWEDEGFVKSDNPTGCYIYETQAVRSLRVGRKMIDAVAAEVEVCMWPEVYTDINSNGVIWYPEACRNTTYAEETSFDSYLQKRYTNHTFTTETPTTWPLQRRVATHLAWIKTAVDELAGRVVC